MFHANDYWFCTGRFLKILGIYMGAAAILVMSPGPSQEGSTCNLALIGQAVLEKKILKMEAVDNPLGSFFFINTFIQSI